MVHLVYQGNDEIATHISCLVSSKDAARESAIAKRLQTRGPSRYIPNFSAHQDDVDNNNNNDKNNSQPSSGASVRRKRTFGIESGLTVAKATKDAVQNHNESADLQDVFLPTTGTIAAAPTQADTISATTTMMSTMEEEETRHARGREVFGFQTNRKNAGLKSIIEHEQQLQLEHRQQQQQQQQQQSTHTGQRKSARSTRAKDNVGEQETLDEAVERETKRRRFTKTVSKMDQANSEDEEEEEEENDEGEDDDSDDDNNNNNDSGAQDDFMNTHHTHDANDAQKLSFFEEDEMGTERYFQDLHQKSRTSNNTLSKLPTLEHAEFMQAIRRAPVKHAKEMEMLMLLYEEQFSQWYFELMSGFNLLIYGYGSKRALLTKFATTILTDAPLIIVNGYFPTVSIKSIVDKISAEAMQYSGPTGTLQEQIAFIHAYFRQPDQDRGIQKLYLLIHNIDGSSLRSEKAQAALSLLAACPKIHLVASMDHINTNILWDAVKASRFRWVWHELTTFRPYLTETSYENSIMVRQGELGARGVQFVLASLTSNGKGLFRILAEHQIEAEREAAETRTSGARNHADGGMAYHTLYKRCQEDFLVSNDVTFRTQLTEFRDHRIMHSKKGADGVETLFIPLSADILEGILEKMS
ncbi:Origin recognition complex subunit 2 [Dissophora globulifera]|uniref:Origin recognition complex subunit 2 n=1 Tax=Dissophora globulifera TaxID=979702 RepID=A0A9P6RDM6_9FUNG|nr:Origin recognition complex subunit 2 [Dissophora globulifera]